MAKEDSVRRASPGMLRTVYTDPRDHEEVNWGERDSAAQVRESLFGSLAAMLASVKVYNDRGEEVDVFATA